MYSDNPDVLLHAFIEGVWYEFAKSRDLDSSVFGGPALRSCEVGWGSLLVGELLHIATLFPRSVDLAWKGFHVPLLFGMTHPGCNLVYRFDDTGAVNVIELEGDPTSADWPYRGFPQVLPCYPLEVATKRACSWEEFSDATNDLPEDQPAELVVVVPPPRAIGVSLWGWEGDRDGVELYFECYLQKKTINVVAAR